MASLVMSARSAAELDQVAPMLPNPSSLVPTTAPLKVRKQRTSRKAAVAKGLPEGGEGVAAVEAEAAKEGSVDDGAKVTKTVAAKSASKRDIVKMVVARAKKNAAAEADK